jgi:hypothetical protein
MGRLLRDAVTCAAPPSLADPALTLRYMQADRNTGNPASPA